MPRTQVTICGAPKAIAMPIIAPIHQPQEIRFAIAMPPKTMMRITATGVSHARMFDCREFAPVKNGEACASANCGSSNAAASATMRAVGRQLFKIPSIPDSLKILRRGNKTTAELHEKVQIRGEFSET